MVPFGALKITDAFGNGVDIICTTYIAGKHKTMFGCTIDQELSYAAA